MYILRQPELCEVVREPSVPLQVEAYRDQGAVKLQYVATKKQTADVLMKPLARVKFDYFRDNLGVL